MWGYLTCSHFALCHTSYIQDGKIRSVMSLAPWSLLVSLAIEIKLIETESVSSTCLLHRKHNCCYIFILTKYPAPFSRVLCEELIALQLSETFPILQNPKFHYCVLKRLPVVPILGHLNPLHTLASYFKICFVIVIHLHLDLPSSLFPFGSPTKGLCVLPFTSACVGCPTFHVLRGISFNLIVCYIHYSKVLPTLRLEVWSHHDDRSQ
jgi:hypothetical protein